MSTDNPHTHIYISNIQKASEDNGEDYSHIECMKNIYPAFFYHMVLDLKSRSSNKCG